MLFFGSILNKTKKLKTQFFYLFICVVINNIALILKIKQKINLTSNKKKLKNLIKKKIHLINGVLSFFLPGMSCRHNTCEFAFQTTEKKAYLHSSRILHWCFVQPDR